MRKVLHAISRRNRWEWRPFVQKAVKELLDAAEKKGRMDVMRESGNPLRCWSCRDDGRAGSGPWLYPELAEKLLYIGPGARPDEAVTEGMKGMIDYVSPWSTSASSTPATTSSRSWRAVKRRASSPGTKVLVNTSLLLLPGTRPTINLLCNGTLAFHQPPRPMGSLKQDPPAPQTGDRRVPALHSPVKSIQRIAPRSRDARKVRRG